ncbi:unnamed protein product [Linum tenue]|uniref:Uncharacterized protein n=1 Tax=Linum tenue TaxID=586396 RepID=A0AAV0SAM5_9ROSI|nr:unnamed protein product [Linum tenue]
MCNSIAAATLSVAEKQADSLLKTAIAVQPICSLPKKATLHSPNPSPPQAIDEKYGGHCYTPPSCADFITEAKALFSLAFPIALTALILYSRSILSMLFLGHLGDLELAAGSLAIAFANITGYSVLSGLSLGMDPLCSQAFGAKQPKLLSLTLHRSVIFLLFCCIPISFLWINVAQILVGNELGAGRPNGAKLSAGVAVLIASVMGLTASTFASGMRWRWGRMFTGDAEILRLTSAALPILGLCELGNCPQTVGCGVLRGSARPASAANVNLGAFYLVGLPVAVGLAFWAGVGFCGLWIGLLSAQICCAGLMLYVVGNTDWCFQARRAQSLTCAGGGGVVAADYEDDGQPLMTQQRV